MGENGEGERPKSAAELARERWSKAPSADKRSIQEKFGIVLLRFHLHKYGPHVTLETIKSESLKYKDPAVWSTGELERKITDANIDNIQNSQAQTILAMSAVLIERGVITSIEPGRE